VRHLRILIATLVIAFIAAPAAAQTGPYTDGETPTSTLAPAVTVVAEGLDVQFAVAGLGADCAWDFGDGTTGTGNPIDHVYAADGTYDVNADCGAVLGISRTLTFAANLSFTGFDTGTFVLIALGLLILGGGVVAYSRRNRSTESIG